MEWKNKLSLVGVFSLVVLTGCSSSPDFFSRQDLLQLAEEDRAAIYADNEPANGDLTLEQSISRALLYNRERRVQMLETALSASRLELTSFDMLPQLAASAGYSKRSNLSWASSVTLNDKNTTGFVAGTADTDLSTGSERENTTRSAVLNWSVLDFGLSYVRAQQGTDRYLIAKERERKAVHNLMQDVRTAYWRAVSAQRLLDRVEPLAARVSVAIENSRQIELELLENPLEALQFQRDLLDIQRNLDGLHKDLVGAKTTLASLMGMSPDEEYRLSDDGPGAVPALKYDVKTMERAALAFRPELAEAQYTRRVTDKEGTAALLQLMPNLSLNAGAYYDSNMFQLNNDWTSVGATVGMNLLNVFRYPAQKRDAEAAKSLAEEQRMALTVGVLSQVYLSHVAYGQSIEAYENAVKYLDVVERIRVQMEARVGAENYTELDLIREEFTTMLAEVRRDVAYADLQNSYGRIFVTAGLDPFPATVPDVTVDGLAKALTRQLMDWDSGRLGLVAAPLFDQIQEVYEGPGDHSFTFSTETFVLGGNVAYEARQVNGEALPTWWAFDTETRTFKGNPPGGIQYLDVILTASNDMGLSSQDVVRFTFEDTNDVPTLTALDDIKVEAGSLATGQFSRTDVEGELLVFDLIEGPKGFSITRDGIWRYDPTQEDSKIKSLNEGESLSDIVKFQIVDPNGDRSVVDLDFLVQGVNDAPIVSSTYYAVVFNEDDTASKSVWIRAYDPDKGSKPVKYRFDPRSDVPQGVTLDQYNTVVINPNQPRFQKLRESETLIERVKIEVYDEHGAVSDPVEIAITIHGQNDKPVLQGSELAVTVAPSAGRYFGFLNLTDVVDPEGTRVNYKWAPPNFNNSMYGYLDIEPVTGRVAIKLKEDGTPFIKGRKKVRLAAIDEDGGETVLEVSLTVTDQVDNPVAMVDVD